MNIETFSSFLNEAKGKKDPEVAEAILKILTTQPSLKSKAEKSKFPSEKGLYSISTIKTHLEDKYTSQQIDDAMFSLQKDKQCCIASINVKNYDYDSTYPYYYDKNKYTKEEISEIKDKYEEWSKENAKTVIDKKKEQKEKVATKPKGKRVMSDKTKEALAKSRAERASKKDKKVQEGIIFKFSELYESCCANELEKGVDPVETKKAPIPNNNLKTAEKIKNISLFLDEVDTKIIDVIKDKNVPINTYRIAGLVNANIDDVHNILEKLESDGKIKRKIIGKDNYWSL